MHECGLCLGYFGDFVCQLESGSNVELHDQTARDNQIVRSVLLLWGGPGFHLTLETPNCGHHNGYDVMFI